MSENKIPFVDLGAQYATIRDEVHRAMDGVIADTAFILGREVEAFEREFAAYTGFRHVVGVGNGTDAIELALRAHGLKAGDRVMVPAHTFMATAEATTRAGGAVALSDVCERSFCMSGATFERAVTSDTRFVLPVPIYGNPAGLDEVVDAARRRGIVPIVDAAQAHGATVGGKKLGQIADTATFSFYPGKNLGAYGDAGAVATNDDEVARLLRMWRNHGRASKFDHEFEATNSRMDGLQGAVLRVKLRHLEEWTEGRRTVAATYRELLADHPAVRLPEERDGARHVYHLFVVRVEDRDGLRRTLGEAGIATGIHYPLPLHRLTAYRRLGHGKGSFPVSEAICEDILSLPMYAELTRDQITAVCGHLTESSRPVR